MKVKQIKKTNLYSINPEVSHLLDFANTKFMIVTIFFLKIIKTFVYVGLNIFDNFQFYNYIF